MPLVFVDNHVLRAVCHGASIVAIGVILLVLLLCPAPGPGQSRCLHVRRDRVA